MPQSYEISPKLPNFITNFLQKQHILSTGNTAFNDDKYSMCSMVPIITCRHDWI